MRLGLFYSSVSTHVLLLWHPGVMVSMESRRLVAEAAGVLIKQPFQLLTSVVLIKQPVEQIGVVAPPLESNPSLHQPTRGTGGSTMKISWCCRSRAVNLSPLFALWIHGLSGYD